MRAQRVSVEAGQARVRSACTECEGEVNHMCVEVCRRNACTSPKWSGKWNLGLA